MINTPDNFVAGKISENFTNWTKLTSDKWILKNVKGYKIEFDKYPRQLVHPSPIRFRDEEKALITEEIHRLERVKIIERVLDFSSNKFLSNIFLREKKDGTHRVILNLKSLNNNVKSLHFKMETLKSAINLLGRNHWMASIDLKDAYYSIPVHEIDRQYLRFVWQNQKYQFTCLPNGLATAPRVFTKMLKPIYSSLWKIEFSNVAYIDDSLLIAETKSECIDNIEKTLQLVDSLDLLYIQKSQYFNQRKV